MNILNLVKNVDLEIYVPFSGSPPVSLNIQNLISNEPVECVECDRVWVLTDVVNKTDGGVLIVKFAKMIGGICFHHLMKGSMSGEAKPSAASSSAQVKMQSNQTEHFMGFDTLGVKRLNAPEVKVRTVGNFARACFSIASKTAAKAAMKSLQDDVYAKSTVDPRLRKLKTLIDLGKAADPPFELILT